jgi:hypothetical protein
MKKTSGYVLLLFCFCVFSIQLFGQGINKEKIKADGETYLYYSMQPQGKVNGIVILFPSLGEKPQCIFDKTSIPKLLEEKGYLTIVPELHNLLFADQYTINEINQIIKALSEKYAVSNFVIGGLSSGGAIAVAYTEYLLASDTSNVLKGVFAIDSPLDLSRIYASAERKIKYSCGGLITKEGYSIKSELDHTLGGPPDAKPGQYLKYSCYSASATDGGNAKFLKNIPVRLYCEPDLDFVRNTYCADLQLADINAFDLESLNHFLLKIGKSNSEYIATKGKGFHTWNIIEPADFVDWALKISK